MKYIIPFILILFLSSCSGGESKHDHYNDAYQSYLDGDYKKALHSVNEALHLDSTNTEYHKLRGQIYAEFGDTLHYNEEVSYVLQHDKYDADKYRHLNQLIDWENHKNNPTAQKLIAQELTLFENDTTSHLGVIDFVIKKFLETGDTIAVKDLCVKTIEQYPNKPDPYLHLANVEILQEDYRDAIKHYKKYIEFDNSNANVLCNLGYCYNQLNSKSKAKEYYKFSADLGNIEACQQYRELTARTRYYTRSVCCDGSTSSSTGRGTCSHHGGVCGIEHVPYKEYVYSCN
jgi:tetratricopeptide (TPR) repeat protein